MLTKKFILTALVAAMVSMVGAAQADSVPVVNANQQYDAGSNNNNNSNNQANQNSQYLADNQTNLYAPPTRDLSMSQRVSRLEAQVDNQQSMNLPSQLQQLQQQMEQLQGQLQTQAHEIDMMKQALAARKGSHTETDAAANNALQQTPATTAAAANTTAATSTTTTGGNFLSDQDAYQAAYNLITSSKYAAAITSMQNYLQQYPNGRYVANANYWLGELYLLQHNNTAAIKSFQTVITKYPSSDKLQDAMLKLGLIYYDNGQLSLAKTQLQKVVKNYPNTTVARLANARLQDINQQTAQASPQPAAASQADDTDQNNSQQSLNQTDQASQSDSN